MAITIVVKTIAADIMAMKRNLLIILCSVLLAGCQRGVIYTQFVELPQSGWDAQQAITFTPTITDTITDYQLQLTLRHNDRYPYQNMWMFVEIIQDSLLVQPIDTIECYLANERGEWQGGGICQYELPMIYDNNYRFKNSGTYHISIKQGMRSEQLQGITAIGIKIISNEQK
jgi:gliding motility-associated lipoprotein GldH